MNYCSVITCRIIPYTVYSFRTSKQSIKDTMKVPTNAREMTMSESKP